MSGTTSNLFRWKLHGDGRSIAPGIYWLRLTQGANQKTTRVAVIE